jgi:glycosyltransferase involved in cell wall biosynthesis
VIEYIKESGIPALCHVHVAMKAGIIALWLKNKKSIPYVISEHWTGFLPEADDKITDKSFYLQSTWKRIVSNADGFSTVSNKLAEAIQKLFAVKQISIIPNVVNTSIFYPAIINHSAIRFIHISSLAKFKNAKAIIQAVAILQKEYPSAILDVFGSEGKELKTVVTDLQLEKSIHFHSEVPQQVLAEYVRQSTALILYSNYETFGCVIIEANACGIPVIVSDIPVFHETVTEGINGTFVPANNPEALAKRMTDVINNHVSFSKQAIEASSLKYSYENVGKQFSNWYNEILSKL